MKVKDILAKIGDGPLITVLEERGYVVLGDDDTEEAIDFVEARGYMVREDMSLEDGWILWRSGSPLFPEWLRKFFWEAHGRGD